MNAMPENLSREDQIGWLKRQREHYEEQEKACRLQAEVKRAEADLLRHGSAMLLNQAHKHGLEKQKAQEALLALMEEE